MAVAFVNGINGKTGSGTSLNLPALNTLGGNFLILAVGWNYSMGETTVSISDTAGNTYTPIGTTYLGASFKMNFWFVDNCKGNASNVVAISGFSSANSIVADIAQYSGWGDGVTTAGQETNGHVASGTGFTSGAFTPNAGDIVAAYAFTFSSVNTFTQGTNYVGRNFGTQNEGYEERIGAPGGSQTASMSWSVTTGGDYLIASFTPTYLVHAPATSDYGRYPYESRTRWLTTKPIKFSPVPAGDAPDLVIVPPSPVPPVLPPMPRYPWNPERSWYVKGSGLGNQDPGRPIPPSLPDRFARGWWVPTRDWRVNPPWFETVVTIPKETPAFYGPVSFARPLWNPNRNNVWREPMTRPPFTPTGALGIPWPPMLPDRHIRTRWNPAFYGTHTYDPPGIAPTYAIFGPARVFAGIPFDCTLMIQNASSADHILVLGIEPFFALTTDPASQPGYFGPVSVPGRPSLPTALYAAYSAAGWIKVLPGGQVVFGFQVVIYKQGAFSIGARIKTAIANDLDSLRLTLRTNRTIPAAMFQAVALSPV